MKRKEKHWVKFRHKFFMAILRTVMRPVAYLKFHYRYKKFKEQKEPYLIFYNHQTVWDQFLVGLICNNSTYFVMSDDLASIKFATPIMNFLIHPIPYAKSSTDFTILRTCKKVVSEGGSIAISAEGNRTYSGQTEYIKASTIKMIKFLKIPVAILHIEGGYGVFPRWADKARKAKFYGYVYKTYHYEDYKDLSNEELYKLICGDLYVDESTPSGPYKSKHSAEYLERVIYNCPKCGFTSFHSHKMLLTCDTCNMTLKYNEYKQFEGINEKAPFQNVKEWYIYQQEELFKMNILNYDHDHLFFSDQVKYIKVYPRKKKEIIAKKCTLNMYNNRIEIFYNNTHNTYLFDDISSSGVFGRNKLAFYIDKYIIQFKGDCHFNAMKYVNLHYKYRLEKGDETNDKFLGL